MSVKFSIVIPTRNRPETLRSSILSCLNQSFNDFEIIVSDNNNSVETQDVLRQIQDNRLHHIRTPKLLSMSENWEFAIEHVRGEFVILIGDDDGLLPHALESINNLLQLTNAQALRWPWVHYAWPNATESLSNRGCDFLTTLPSWCCTKQNGLTAVKEMLAFNPPHYAHLPMLYNSAISINLIRQLRSLSGRIFSSITPDVYSGIAFALLSGEFWCSELPMSIAGLSGSSNGSGNLNNLPSAKSTVTEFWTLNEKSPNVWNSQIPQIRNSLVCAIAESFIQANQVLPDYTSSLNLDRKKLIDAIIKFLQCENQSIFDDAMSSIKNSLNEYPKEISQWFESKYGNLQWKDHHPLILKEWCDSHHKKGYDGVSLRLNVQELGVADVFQAAQLYEKLFCCQSNSQKWQTIDTLDTNERLSLWKRLKSSARILIKGR